METAPKSLRLQIGLFGRTNVGKSSFLNMVAGQDVSITSPLPGATTDIVEKAMEMLPIGPVVLLDTGGLDDESRLAPERLRKTRHVFDRADVFVLLVEPGVWGDSETRIVDAAAARKAPCIVVVNKTDLAEPSPAFIQEMHARTPHVCRASSVGANEMERNRCVDDFKRQLLATLPEDYLRPPPLVGDLLPPGGLAVLVVPIDLQAPKGRLILPQVQTIRDALDNDAAALVVKEREFAHVLGMLRRPPDIVVCDSQVVLKMVADAPPDVKCTTFSILFARQKGDLNEMARGVAAIERLEAGDKVLVSEACSHHAIEDDIGRVKIPRWLRQYVGADVQIDLESGRDYPPNLAEYKLVIHCGACMLTRREMLFRIHQARRANVPITNYGVCISFLQGVAKRVLSPFPSALDAFEQQIARI
ncbi:MAG: [FeFe] hydrogenase H-cluster maturation GTPase HydF [Syntrophobacteraceae bacterium]